MRQIALWTARFGISGLLSVSAAALPAQAACTLGAVAVLPVSVYGGHFYTDIQINGQTAQFIIDTGAFATVLDTASAIRLGVKASALDADVEGIGGVRQLSHGVATHMRVGGMTADGMNLGVTQLWAANSQGMADGLFGMNMMAAYDLDLDFAGGHMIMFEADGACRKPNVALAPPLYIAQLEPIVNNREAVVFVEVEGEPVKALIDSGAPETVMFRSQASRLGVDLSPLHAPGHATGSGIGPFPVAAMKHVFKSVAIGDLRFENMPITIIDQVNQEATRRDIGSLIAGGDPEAPGQEQMLLGADFLNKVHVWISHSSHKLVMQYPPQPSVLPH